MNEELLRTLVFHLVRITEALAAIVIFSGAIVGFLQYLYYSFLKKNTESFSKVRLGLGRFLALGLEFQLASDLLRTAVAPSFEEIGKLAAVATIRTALNYFLNREIQAERLEAAHDE